MVTVTGHSSVHSSFDLVAEPLLSMNSNLSINIAACLEVLLLPSRPRPQVVTPSDLPGTSG